MLIKKTKSSLKNVKKDSLLTYNCFDFYTINVFNELTFKKSNKAL